MASRVLLVEDDDDVRTSLGDLLYLLPDCELTLAANLAEARRAAATCAPGSRWDLVLSDERLPDGRGTDLLAELGRAHAARRLVLMSAFQDFDMVVRAVNDAHVDDFIQKPYDPGRLLEQVARMLEETRAWSPDPARPNVYKRAPPSPGSRKP